MSAPKELLRKQLHSTIDFILDNINQEQLEVFNNFMYFSIGTICESIDIKYEALMLFLYETIIEEPMCNSAEKEAARLGLSSLSKADA
jgi:hypothetical protein